VNKKVDSSDEECYCPYVIEREEVFIMEIKHYKLHQGLDQDILYTYVKIGKRDFYLKRETWNNIKTFCIILLTTTAAFAIV
jgi:hypothetical protein